MAISLKIENLRKSFAGKVILKDINIEAKTGDIIGLIGKSGCGKSTLLKILVGYHKADSGQIILNDKDISKKVSELRKMVGYTTQENSFYDKLTILENMRYYANLYNVPASTREKRISHLLKQVGLIEHKNKLAENISGGMKRRLDFAISLAHNPRILILDEPTTGLDPLLIEQFWEIVKDVVKEEDKIVIMTSHILPEIEKYSNKVAVMHNGVIAKVLSGKQVINIEMEFKKSVGKE